MSDLRFSDAACCWVLPEASEGVLFFFFDEQTSIGFESLAKWRFEHCKKIDPSCAYCCDCLGRMAFENTGSCSWCGRGLSNCFCEYLGDGPYWESSL